MMTTHRLNTDDTEVADFNENWARWREMVHDLPEVRAEKVEAVRRALESHSYDTDEVLDETIRRIADEMDPADDSDNDPPHLRFHQ